MAPGNEHPNLDRIVTDPAILGGKPVIEGTRIPVSLILNLLANGADNLEIQADYPDLTERDIRSAIAYAADRVDQDTATLSRPM